MTAPTTDTGVPVRRRADGSIDHATKRRLGTWAIAFALAAGAFWATMLTDPPRSEAGVTSPVSVQDQLRNVPLDLPL